MVITRMNSTRSVIQGKHYVLPAECAGVLSKWWKTVCGPDSDSRRRTTYNVLFTDATGDAVAAFPISFDNRVLCNFAVGRDYMQVFGRDGREKSGLYLTPMVSMCAKSRERWVGFDLPRELLPQIKSVKIELAE